MEFEEIALLKGGRVIKFAVEILLAFCLVAYAAARDAGQLKLS